MLTPEELARNEQVGALLRNRASGAVPRRMPNAEIEQLLQAASIIGGGRAEGLSDGETIQRLVRGLVRENDRRQGGATERGNAAERALIAEGLAADATPDVDVRDVLAAQAEYGFNDEKEARLAQEAGRKADNYDGLRAQIQKARNMREGRKREAVINKLEGKLQERQERQMLFDAGVGPQQDPRIVDFNDPKDTQGLLAAFDQDPFNPDLQRAVAARAAGIQGGRQLGNKAQQFDGVPLELGQNLRGRPGIGVPDGDFVEVNGEMIPVPRGMDKEKGNFVLVPDGQGGRKRMWRERGQLFTSPDATANVQGRPEDVANEIYRPEIRGNSEAERKRLAEQDRAMGQSEVRRFERYERGDLTTEEMQNIARLEGGRAVSPIRVPLQGPAQNVTGYGKVPAGFVTAPDGRGVKGEFKGNAVNKDGVMMRLPNQVVSPQEAALGKGMQGPRQQMGERNIVRAGVPGGPTPDEAQAAIMSQLQARKEANRAGRRERIMQANIEDAGLEAILLGGESRLRGKAAAEGQDNIKILGQLKGDKLKRDMGLVLGDQRANAQNAIRVEMPDGSIRHVDVNGQDLASPSPKTAQTVGTAQMLNAPDGANNALDFVMKNEYEDRGAQFFGDEGIIGNMNDKGAGGGIEQVDIGGALRGIEEKVAARLGIDPKRIGGIKGFQAAMNAINEDERRRGNAPIRLEDGQKVRVDNPGVEEALLALKVQPAEARQIANALKQKELAQFDRFDPRVAVDSAIKPGPNPANVVAGVNDPKRGGDRVDIAKDVRFQGKVQNAVENMNGTAQREFMKDIGARDVDAGKPFVGRVQGEPAFGGYNNVMLGADGKAMDAVDVRIAQEERNRGNREKKVANMAKQGKRIKFGIEDDRRDVAKIRQMQEGNIFAAIRAERAQAQAQNALQNVNGRLVQDDVPVPGDFQAPRVGYKKVVPGVKRKGDVELLPRPQRPRPPQPPHVVDAGEGFRNVQVPEGYKPQSTAPAPRGDRRRIFRDAGIVSGGVLASILGLNAMRDNEEEREAA